MSIIAVIPARGGSKRIIDKNIKPFMGRPIITYSINEAKKTNIFDRIIVSTDSDKIAAIAIENGAEVPFMRPRKLADDKTNTAQVILHCINKLADEGENVKYICCIYATAPLIKAEYIIKGLNILNQYDATTCFPVTTYSFPILRSLKIENDNRLEMIWPEFKNKRSQDLPDAYHDAGQFYWIDAKKFKKERTLYSNDAVPIILPRHLVQDIDNLEDWKIAEYMFRVQQLGTDGYTDRE